MKHTAKAHVNIALIKYWGKKDSTWNLPLTSSLSLTLDKFYTITTVEYHKEMMEDHLYIDGNFILGEELNRVVKFMNWVRKLYGIPYFARIESQNYVPKKAGLASSSSAFAALALAATKAYGLDLSQIELSKLARLGSGSAARSIYGDFAIWHEGESHDTSYAESFGKLDDIAVIVCLIDQGEKKVDSRTAMLKLDDYPELKETWIDTTNDYIKDIKKAFKKQDFKQIGEISQSHAELMHYIIQETGTSYLTNESFLVLDLVEKLKNQGHEIYATMDAGPNIKILVKKDAIKDVLPAIEKKCKVIVCYPGNGVTSL